MPETLENRYNALDSTLVDALRFRTDCLADRHGTAGNQFEANCLRSALVEHLLGVEGKGPDGWLWDRIDEESRHTHGMEMAPWAEVCIHGWHLNVRRLQRGAMSLFVDRWLASAPGAPDFFAVMELADGQGEDVLYRWVGWCPAATVLRAPVVIDSPGGRLVELARDDLEQDPQLLIKALEAAPPPREASRRGISCDEARCRLASSDDAAGDSRDAFEHFLNCKDCSTWSLEARPLLAGFLAPVRAETMQLAAAEKRDGGPVSLAVVNAGDGELRTDYAAKYSGEHHHHAAALGDRFYLEMERLPRNADALIFFVSRETLSELRELYPDLGEDPKFILASAYRDRKQPQSRAADLGDWPHIGRRTDDAGSLSWTVDLKALRGWRIPDGSGILVALRLPGKPGE